MEPKPNRFQSAREVFQAYLPTHSGRVSAGSGTSTEEPAERLGNLLLAPVRELLAKLSLCEPKS